MNYQDLISYFRLLAAGHQDIRSFVCGDDEAILKLEKDQIKYPCLVLEVPTAKPIGDMDSHQVTWNIAYTVLINATDGNTGQQEANLVLSFNISLSILLKLKADAGEGLFRSLNIAATRSERVYSLHNDNDQGWRTETSITARPPRYCIDESNWDSTISYLLLPSFNLLPQPISKGATERFFSIELINFRPPYEGNYSIRYSTSGTTYTTTTQSEGITIPVDAELYAEITIDFGDIIFELSAHYTDQISRAESIPFLNNPFV